MTRPHIGALRHRLIIETPIRISDGGGGVSESWSAIATVWGALEPTSGAEASVAEGFSGGITHVATIRHRPDLKPAMRFRLGVRILEITALLNIAERGRHLKCLCRERDL